MTATMSASKLRRCLLKALALFVALVCCLSFPAAATGEDSTEQADEGTSQQEKEQTTEENTTDEAYQELESQYEKLEQEMEKNQEKLDKVQESLDEQEKVVDGLGNQISSTQNEVDLLTIRYQALLNEQSNTESQIELITKQLGSLSSQIEQTGAAITEKQEQLEVTYELLKQRIRAMYMAGSGSTLEFLLTSEDFSTLLTRTELLVRVAQHDNDLMATLQDEVSELEQLETTLTDSVTAQETKKTDLSSKTQSLESSKSKIQATSDELKQKREELKTEMEKEKQELNALDKESDEYKALISKQEDELIALSAQMEEFIKNSGSSTTDKDEETTEPDGEETTEKDEPDSKDNPYLDGTETVFSSGMIFPLKCSGVYISSPYGMRTHPITGEYKLHTGTDFCAAGIDGKTVYAVKDGEVIYAAKHKAYGNFVIIDHGKGISSCYAHMQDGSMRVSVGDKVQQGQPIGKVGDTGYSTAPHLHFEIRVDGSTVNPMSGYIKLPG
ncbi:MAG: peptidoglycan DD-metalloendopeptidase family protein [Clostridia bacterium]|nr:peptidoglycan DD-metalloendopeptidase family protein [Clostridia bacterium]